METLHPGIYTVEKKGTPPMEGSSTSTGAFVGVAPKGVVGQPKFITNWTEYKEEFGEFAKNSDLAYAVRGFFENGGKRAYVVRVVQESKEGVSEAKKAEASFKGTVVGEEEAGPAVLFQAKNEGVWGNDVAIKLVKNVDPYNKEVDSKELNLEVYFKKELVEVYENVKLDTLDEAVAKSKFIGIVVISEIELKETAELMELKGGKNGDEKLTDFDFERGLEALSKINFDLVALPGVTSAGAHQALLAFAENTGTFAILDSPRGLGRDEILAYISKENLISEMGALYYPGIVVSDPIGVGDRPLRAIAPSGHLMGIYARTDNTRGVFKAPAGVDARVRGAVRVEVEVSDGDQDILNPRGVNAIRAFEGEGIIVWGARTLAKGEYKYIPVRRTVNFIRKSLHENMRWTVFEPNHEPLWGKIRSTTSNFLTNFWSAGGLRGTSAGEAFFVKCDSENNTDESIDAGRTNIEIGIAPVKPAEFVVFTIGLTR